MISMWLRRAAAAANMTWRVRVPWWSAVAGGFLAGATMVWAAQELVFVDWRPVAEPLQQTSLVIRQDAKGDGRFGAPRSGHRRHRGVDIEAPIGTPVRVIRSGTVVETGEHRGLGLFVGVEHKHHLRSLYAHLQAVQVRVGTRLRQGQIIGTVGKTGNARHRWVTPHLHLEVERDNMPIDPAALGLTLVEPTDRRSYGDDGGA